LSNLVGPKVPGRLGYSKDLRECFVACLKEEPEEWPSASKLLTSLRRKRTILLSNGLLNKVPFEFCD
jgi:hypothetical protein